MPYLIIPRLLNRYRVYLRECVDGEYQPEIAFDCDAEDALHAVEQAKDAYPNSEISWTKNHRLDVQKEDVVVEPAQLCKEFYDS